MNTSKLRSSVRRKRVVVPAIAAVAVLGIGGTVWSATADDRVDGGERDRVGAAATQAVGGTVVDVETSDDAGEAYEVEVRLEDGTEVDVALDESLSVVAEDRDDDADDRDDTDDRVLGDTERRAAEEAALAAVGGGTVLEVEASDDRGVAYEVDLRDADGAEWDVDLDGDLRVVGKRADR